MSLPAQVIDLFCGVGGLTRGLLDAGLNVIAGFDIDGTCRYAYDYGFAGFEIYDAVKERTIMVWPSTKKVSAMLPGKTLQSYTMLMPYEYL